ncbi:B12-binding domain-containing protein [Fibrobacterota bacterium]
MPELVDKIAICIERGKINIQSPFPTDLKGQEGADELAAQAVKEGITPDAILESCILGMEKIGDKFSKNQAFVPELLMSAKAMTMAMEHLKPFFDSGAVKTRGTFVIGTVAGDLHDIGKNIVAMVVKGGGWEIIDLGVDVPAERFAEEAKKHPDCVVGLSTLLTTTLENMENTIKLLREQGFTGKVIIGGAPVTQEIADKVGADVFGANPQDAQKFLDTL